MTSMTVGNIRAISRPTPIDTFMRSVLAPSNRCCSWASLTKARMTRTPPICSRRILLSRSIFSCIDLNKGRILEMIRITQTNRVGTITTSRDDR
jgi:hypothetical protein